MSLDERLFPDEQLSERLLRRLTWIGKETGLTENLVLKVLVAAAKAPDSEGSAQSGFLLYGKGDLRSSVFPLWETKCLVGNETAEQEWTKFEVYGEVTKR